MRRAEAVATLAALEEALERAPHEVFGVGIDDDVMTICVAYACAAALYNPSRFAGTAPDVVQRATIASAKLRAIFQKSVADAQVRTQARARRSTHGRRHPRRR
jgi:hypothetical protein